jgi:hypothetical protein
MMVFDHLYQFFSAQGIPRWFHWIGRPALPIFLFLCAEAFWYTHSRTKYMARLFAGFALMNIIRFVLPVCLPAENIDLMYNVFQTLFLAAFYMLCTKILIAGIRERRGTETAGAVALMLLPAVLGYLLISLPPLPYGLKVVFSCIPNILFTEGSFIAVILGVLLYLFRENRLIQALIITALGVLALIMTLSGGEGLLDGSPHWLLIFALVPILLYNDKRGSANTWFFYIFYPAHIVIFYIIAWFLQN